MNALPPSYDLLVRLSNWAWSTSLEAWPLALAVLLAGWAGWLPARTRVWLAALFFFRLILPAVPSVAWPWAKPAMPLVPESGSGITTAAVAAPSFSWGDAWPVLWTLGMLATLSWLVISHLRFSRWISLSSQPVSPTLHHLALQATAEAGLTRRVPMCALAISTPAIFGWWRPRLLVPRDLEERFTRAQIHAMLLHELAHVRRRDVLATWLSLLVVALHWFNPLAWLVCRRFAADREVLCDAAALARRDDGFRQHYGEALLRALQGPAPLAAPALAPFFQLHRELRRRLLLIMKPTPPNLVARLLAVLLVPSLGIVTFTTAKAEPKPAAAEEGGNKPEGDGPKKGPAEDGAPKKGPRDGEGERKGPRDGDGEKKGPRDGEKKREGDGEKKRDGDGENKRKGPRDGEGEMKKGPRDGDSPRTGPRDGETKRTGPRDGEVKKTGPRDGDKPKNGEGDGDGAKPKGD